MLFSSTDHNLTWSKKFTKSTENCYNISEARVFERGPSSIIKNRFISPVRTRNKNFYSTSHFVRSTSPESQSNSTSSTRTISSTPITETSTPTQRVRQFEHYSQTLNWRVLQRDKAELDAVEADKSSDFHYQNLSLTENQTRKRGEFNRTIAGVPYREKRNPLGNARLSCYKPSIDTYDIKTLKNFKSVDDFLSLDIQTTRDLNENLTIVEDDIKMSTQNEQSQPQTTNNDGMGTLGRAKKASKLKSMSDKTRKLFSKIYSNSNQKGSSSSSSTEVCNDFIIHRPAQPSSQVSVSGRRSLSYGTLPVNEYEVKKIEIEDGDSGILVNESGASSMVETDSSSEDTKQDPADVTMIEVSQPKYVTTLEL